MNRPLRHLHLYLLMMLLGGAGPSAVRGEAFFSEIFLGDPATTTMPTAVELYDIDHFSHVQILVLDAMPGSYGNVVQVITLPVSNNAMVITETDWPTGLWPNAPGANAQALLGELGTDEAFNFQWARTLLLYDRQTDVAPNHTKLTSALQTERLGEARLLDAVTLKFGTWVDPAAPGAILAAAAGSAHIRIYDNVGNPTATWASGLPGADGRLPTGEPLTPGGSNLIPNHAPEPDTLLLLAGGLLGCIARRGRRPAHCSIGQGCL